MVQQMAMKTAAKMSKKSVIEAKNIRVYAYGLELLFSSLVGVAAVIIISAVFGKTFLWVPYMAGFVPLRLSGGGYHAKTHSHCIFAFSLLFSLILLTERLFAIPAKAWLIACFVNLVIIFLFSPVAATNKPLKESAGPSGGSDWRSPGGRSCKAAGRKAERDPAVLFPGSE